MTFQTILKRIALPAACCLCAATLAHAEEGTVNFLARLGLYDAEFTGSDNTQSSFVNSVSSGRYILGNSYRYSGTTYTGTGIWVYDLQTSQNTRLGYYDGTEYTSSTGVQNSSLGGVMLDDYLLGTSTQYNGSSSATGSAAWVTNLSTGENTRLGLYTGEFTSSTNAQSTSITSRAGRYVVGTSTRYSGFSTAGTAAWAADVTTGVTTRLGLYSSEFTSAAGLQTSSATSVTASGYMSGYSLIYSTPTTGTAIWLANVATGVTSRVGLYTGAEFTKSDGYQYSSGSSALTESGYMAGTSYRYNGANQAGQAVWIANATTGTTTRIGFFTGAEFTKSDTTQYSAIGGSSAANTYIFGTSLRYNAAAQIGQAAWVARMDTGTATRIGFFTGAEYTSSSDNSQSSYVTKATESGYVIGTSTRYSGSANAGTAAWIANAATGVTSRVGFYDAAYTSTSNNTQASDISGITESGYAYGTSVLYSGIYTIGRAGWVASATTGTTTRIGLYGTPEYRSTAANESTTITGITESGYLYGTSTRYNGGNAAGTATWVATASTGTTTRVGLYTGSEFTKSDGTQTSAITGISETGYLSGTSNRYSGSADAGTATWAANASSGDTIRTGLTDSIHTSSTGTQTSTTSGIVAGMYIYGTSTRYSGTTSKGQTAWLFDLNTNAQVSFDLSVRTSDGFAYSYLSGVTDAGFAYGTYTQFDGTTNLGSRVFIWTEEWGTVLLDEATSNQITESGWDLISSVSYALPDYMFVGQGRPSGDSSSVVGVYLAQAAAVPEPGTLGLIGLGLAATLLAARRRFAPDLPHENPRAARGRSGGKGSGL